MLLSAPAVGLATTGQASIVSSLVPPSDQALLREELVALQLDLAAGIIKAPEDVRQPNLRDFMLAARENASVMRDVRKRHEGLSDVDALAIVAAEDLL